MFSPARGPCFPVQPSNLGTDGKKQKNKSQFFSLSEFLCILPGLVMQVNANEWNIGAVWATINLWVAIVHILWFYMNSHAVEATFRDSVNGVI